MNENKTNKNINVLIRQKINEVFAKDYKIIQTSEVGFGKIEDKKILIGEALTTVAKQYIFFHEYYHMTLQDGPAGFSPDRIEKCDTKAIEELLNTNFDFKALFKFDIFQNVKKEYERIINSDEKQNKI